MTLWERFRTQYPQEAAKGYDSGYYRDLKEIDIRLYQSQFQGSKIEALLSQAKAQDMPGLVSAEEIHAIRDNILHEHCKGLSPTPGYEYTFVTYDETLEFIQSAADFIGNVI